MEGKTAIIETKKIKDGGERDPFDIKGTRKIKIEKKNKKS